MHMKIEKAHWTTDGDSYAMGMSIQKVDAENRLVHGWASLDNDDKQDDRVLAEASLAAFQKFRGNIREMHQPIAVGRMVSYKPDTFVDPETGETYNGVFVTAYVSKGAQSTWEKVLDGTLSAFSIKGPIRDSYMEFSKSKNKPIRIIKAYELEELSLVDSGGNQLANIISISKADGTVSGTATEMKSENVFWCEHEGIAKTSSEDALECPAGHNMENIGWFEYNESDRAEKLSRVIGDYLEKGTGTGEGGVEMSKEVKKSADDGVQTEEGVAPGVDAEVAVEEAKEEGVVEPEVAPEDGAAAEGDGAAEVAEVEEESISKMLDDLKSHLDEKLEKNADAVKDVLGEVDEKVGNLEKALDAKISELSVKHEELSKAIEAVKSDVADVEKSLGSISKATGVKKSTDLGGSDDATLEKSDKTKKGSDWNGLFLDHVSLDD